LRLDDAAFRALFTGSAVKRIGYDRFTRNVLIAAGNSGDPALAGPVAEKLKSASALVRAMAVWALGRLVSPDALAELACRWRPGESDAIVEVEWALATGATPAQAMIASAVDLKEGRPS
ncbi:MAG: tRNA epoxyqueuosine(34) reductase QueG, partial [Methylocella sp.]